MVTELGDMARVLNEAKRKDLAELYKALGPAISSDDAQTRTDEFISPRGVAVSEGGHAP
jgi:hypothetical protein